MFSREFTGLHAKQHTLWITRCSNNETDSLKSHVSIKNFSYKSAMVERHKLENNFLIGESWSDAHSGQYFSIYSAKIFDGNISSHCTVHITHMHTSNKLCVVWLKNIQL